MALKFNCVKCGESIIVQYLRVGEVAKCRNCGTKNTVPVNAVETSENPVYERSVINENSFLPEKGFMISSRTVCFILICLTLCLWTYLSCDAKYSYESSRYQTEIGIVKDDLQAIATYLKNYKQKCGRYPDNNEGLSALEDLRNELKANTGENRWQRWLPTQKVLVPFEGGILSRWQEPFVYENRLGLNAQLFRDSPATIDKDRHYSVEVDNGIYLYSVGAKICYDEYIKLRKEELIVFIGPLLILIFFIYRFVKAPKPVNSLGVKIIKWVGGTIMLLGALFIGFSSFSLCYSMAYFTNHKRPEMMREYYSLLDKYHQRGIINQNTYDKVKNAMEKIDNSLKDKWY